MIPQWESPIDELWQMLRDAFGPKEAVEDVERKEQEEPSFSIGDSGHPQVQAGSDRVLYRADGEVTEVDCGLEQQATREPGSAYSKPLDGRGINFLFDIRKFAAWGLPDGKVGLDSAISIFKSEYPGNEARIDDALAKGNCDRALIDKAFTLGREGKTEKDVERLIDSGGAAVINPVIKQIWKKYENGCAARKRYEAEQLLKKNGTPLSSVRAEIRRCQPTVLPKSPLVPRPDTAGTVVSNLHPNDLRSLQPGNTWQLIIDETGQVFDETANQTTNHFLGRFVGVLVPGDKRAIPPLPFRWHAVDETAAEIDRTIQAVLDAPVGVLGIDVRLVPVTPGERWLDGVALLVDWVLRLLPIDKKVKLEVLIEQRGVFGPGQSWDVVRRDCMRRLALAFPQRAARMDLSIRVIGKEGTQLNGYADAIAFTWAQTTASSRERLRRSKLEGTCLLSTTGEIDVRSMLNALDAFTQGVHLPPSTWWEMLDAPESCNPSALVYAMLEQVGNEVHAQPGLWEKLLIEVKGRMSASPVNLQRLAVAVDWLQRYQPKGATILPAMRLVWLTVQLARTNHLGETEQGWQVEIDHLENDLYDEAAPLTCHAALHRAVAATNRYDFETASGILAKWESVPPSVPGLRYYAQVKSSLGQHAAFIGDNKRAITFFRQALEAFTRLSDPDIRHRDALQTGCYLAIALIDDANADAEEVRKAVERVTGPLLTAAERLSISVVPEDRYLHHLLLRWLVDSGDDQVWRAYERQSSHWGKGQGHPWPLIQLYRGMLLYQGAPETGAQLAIDAAQLAFDANQGPTVRLIGACCRIIAVRWGTPWPEAEGELKHLADTLPLAQSRIEGLRDALLQHTAPLDLLREVLPFNFR